MTLMQILYGLILWSTCLCSADSSSLLYGQQIQRWCTRKISLIIVLFQVSYIYGVYSNTIISQYALTSQWVTLPYCTGYTYAAYQSFNESDEPTFTVFKSRPNFLDDCHIKELDGNLITTPTLSANKEDYKLKKVHIISQSNH